ncbi:hypothetical protein [Halovivax sp.]|uniref:hypothetical protein n=1 Tax=Halovivax sp. TaxID=1935978 RepID=UPI0025C72148|nr:hypothetical protein [Halovivax sp.]
MSSSELLVGILGLQLTLVAGTMLVLEAINPHAEGFWLVLLFASVAVTLSGFLVGRQDDE